MIHQINNNNATKKKQNNNYFFILKSCQELYFGWAPEK